MEWIWAIILAVRETSTDPDDRWAVTLAALDRDRAAAFAAADVDLLDDVYVERSRARSTDAATIRSYARRDGRVVGAQMRVLTCRVVRATGTRATLEVVDVLGRAQVVWGDGRAVDLPRDEPSRRQVTLRRTDAGWRVAASVELSRRP